MKKDVWSGQLMIEAKTSDDLLIAGAGDLGRHMFCPPRDWYRPYHALSLAPEAAQLETGLMATHAAGLTPLAWLPSSRRPPVPGPSPSGGRI